MNILISIVLFYAVLFVIAIIDSFRKEKKFLDIKEYMKNVTKSFTKHIKAIAGITVPDPIRDSSDYKYMKLAYDIVHAALENAHSLMSVTGWTLEKDYVHRTLDCEDFAMKMKVEVINFIAKNAGIEGYGVPIGIFGYNRDSDGKGHMLIYAVINKRKVFFEVYPGRAIEPKKLSKKEMASCNLDIM